MFTSEVQLKEHLSSLSSDDTVTNLIKPASFTWRDYMLMLLQVDAGIEHALMVQYLYAAYSLGGKQVPKEKRELVRSWQQTILSIAKEEMGHLITVQNVITLMGGPINMSRGDYPWDSDFYPFPFELEPLSLNSLAKYVYTEAPVGWNDNGEHNDLVEQINNLPIPPKPDVKSVGALFDTVLAILEDPERISDADFQPQTYKDQATWGAWGCNHGQPYGAEAPFYLAPNDKPKAKPTCPTTADVLIIPCASRDDAINALKLIAEQGEAPDPKHENSHFVRFLEVYQEFKLHFPDEELLQPTKNVAVNPTTFKDLKPETGDDSAKTSYIENVVAAKWADLFNMRYRLLLTYLTHSFRLARVTTPEQNPGSYQAVMHKAFTEMYNLKTISEILTNLPLTNDPNCSLMAGPTFQLPYTMDLPESPVSCWLQYKDILVACREVRDWLRDWEDSSTTKFEKDFLNTMNNLDLETEKWLNKLIESSRIAEGVY